MWNFFRDEKYEIEKTCALRLINRLEKELECETLTQDIRERKEIIHKCIKYYYNL
jgi:hypothetical protein